MSFYRYVRAKWIVIDELIYIFLLLCGCSAHVVRRLNKNAYKGKATYRRVSFPQREGVILLIMKKVDESKKAELLSESSLFLFLI
mgnify:CR=1 FL=1